MCRRREGKIRIRPCREKWVLGDATLGPRFCPGSRSAIWVEWWAGAKGVLAQGLAGWPLASGQVVSPVKSRLAVSGVQRREFGGSAARNNAMACEKDCYWKPSAHADHGSCNAAGLRVKIEAAEMRCLCRLARGVIGAANDTQRRPGMRDSTGRPCPAVSKLSTRANVGGEGRTPAFLL